MNVKSVLFYLCPPKKNKKKERNQTKPKNKLSYPSSNILEIIFTKGLETRGSSSEHLHTFWTVQRVCNKHLPTRTCCLVVKVPVFCDWKDTIWYSWTVQMCANKWIRALLFVSSLQSFSGSLKFWGCLKISVYGLIERCLLNLKGLWMHFYWWNLFFSNPMHFDYSYSPTFLLPPTSVISHPFYEFFSMFVSFWFVSLPNKLI